MGAALLHKFRDDEDNDEDDDEDDDEERSIAPLLLAIARRRRRRRILALAMMGKNHETGDIDGEADDDDDDERHLGALLLAAARRTGCDTATTGMSFWTDAAVLAEAGVPSVLFGPGGAGLHSNEEYVTLADVIACRDTLRQLVVDWCG